MTINKKSMDNLTSDLLARMVIDALLRAGIVQKKDVEEAIAVATEEIHVRHLSGELSYE